MRILIFICCALLPTPWVFAQSSSYAPFDADIYNWLDRAAILSGGAASNRLGVVRPYLRTDIAALTDSMGTARLGRVREQQLRRYITEDNNELFADSLTRRLGIWKALYRNRADLYSVRTPEFDFHISPSFYGMLGRDQGDVNRSLYINTRGVELRGTIDKKISFYTYLADNQAILPAYVEQYADRIDSLHPSLPYEAYVKPDVYGVRRRGYYDFITARGHIAFQATKHVAIAFGQDRHFVGDGMRSLIWSDWMPANPFLKVEASVWRIRYTNIFSQLKAGTRQLSDRFIPNKWAAFHQLDVDVSKSVKIGLFESVVFAPGDTSKRGFFDISYLNPIIFYRFVEQYNGSTDNSFIGANTRVDLFRQLRLYGQFLLDEFRFADLRAQNGWWGNKYALQAGAKWINPFNISGLDVQAEYNLVRPFTYSHEDKFRNYASYNLPIAHPAGANFTEITGRFTYQIQPNLRLNGRAMLLRQGFDRDRLNYGQDVLRNYLYNRAAEFGNTVGQGVSARTVQSELCLSYMPWHRIFIDLGLLLRDRTSDNPALRLKTQMVTFAVRWNIARRETWY